MTAIAKRKFVYAREIMRRLPHRYPFLMVGRMIETSPEHAVGPAFITDLTVAIMEGDA